MGAFCSRRNPASQNTQGEGDWIVIRDIPERVRLKPAVRKVIKLLMRRKVWSKIGRWLRTPASHASVRRSVAAQFWHAEGFALEQHSQMFDHLERKKGVLVAKKVK